MDKKVIFPSHLKSIFNTEDFTLTLFSSITKQYQKFDLNIKTCLSLTATDGKTNRKILFEIYLRIISLLLTWKSQNHNFSYYENKIISSDTKMINSSREENKTYYYAATNTVRNSFCTLTLNRKGNL